MDEPIITLNEVRILKLDNVNPTTQCNEMTDLSKIRWRFDEGTITKGFENQI